MPSQSEGRLSLALQAYLSRSITPLRTAAQTYDVPYGTLRERYLGVLLHAQTRTKSRKLSRSEDQLLVQKILQQSEQGFHPQRGIVKEMANIIPRSKQPSQPQTVGKNWVANFVKRNPQLTSVYTRKFMGYSNRDNQCKRLGYPSLHYLC